ncbi:xylose ABC transporter ATP-binding protein [Formosimonas limnophila]|uniref:Xylose ABC transporter ATP-binding protein n=1 Tax=Formosimonas limnophila TaxID=1384487 RepID=A0A8J3CN36_9BURK|nr:sugar ABC transporter ATP-binding protein [Formosimonas limnophila]GHA70538.1 xylose ABC transporter ATP-binding protein [Formosimonas limnophila]
MDTILDIKGLRKTFGSVVALDKVDVHVTRANIHFIVGENGAGKSTMMKVISGVYPHGSYEGQVFYNGQECKFQNIRESEKAGIVIIHQELALSPYLSIYENLFLGNERKKGWLIDWDQTYIDAREVLAKVGITEDLATPVNKLSVAKQQLIEIAKALSKNAKVLILDEPTSSLNEEDSANLLELLKNLKKEGVTIIMISHKLNEVMSIADEITIIRDGETIEYINLHEKQIDVNYIVKGMVGRELTSMYPSRTPNIGQTMLKLSNYTVKHPIFADRTIINNAQMEVKAGEIVGLAGLVGSGRTELMLSIFGRSLSPDVVGDVEFDGKKVDFRSAKEAIANGMIYVSEDRKDLGLVLIQTIKNNASYSSLPLLSNKFGVVDDAEEFRQADAMRVAMRIKTPHLDQIVGNLSGGNQQKVVLARCLMAKPKLLIIDEPTRGIDVGAKNEIYKIMNDFVAQGNAIIMISSELPEVLGMTDRVYVMDKGRIKGEMATKDASQEAIMKLAVA